MTERVPEQPEREPGGTDADGDPPGPDTGTLICEVCGGPMMERHCKITCTVCGYQRDCSDP